MSTKTKNKTLLVILGMHRSGTSLLTSLTDHLGFESGNNLLGPGIDNPKGYWEDRDILEFNDRCLQNISTDWDDPSTLTPKELNKIKKNLMQIGVNLLNEKLKKYPKYVFKNPRTLKLLPFWIDIINKTNVKVKFILIIRNPLSVAESLHKRNNISFQQGFYLWLEYLINFCKSTKKNDETLIVNYDYLLNNPEHELKKISQFVNASINNENFNLIKSKILDYDLRHSQFDFDDLIDFKECPDLIKDIYTVLLRLCEENKKIYSTISKHKSKWLANYSSMQPGFVLASELITEKKILNKNLEQIKGESELIKRESELIKRESELIKRESEQIKHELGAILYSKSWRITKPLRYIGKIKKKLFNRSYYQIIISYLINNTSKRNKAIIKNIVFKNLSFLFKNNFYYKNWKSSNFPNPYKLIHTDFDWGILKGSENSVNISKSTSVDVIIPIYNGFKETQACIESVIASKKICITNFNLILIDDKSKDKNIQILLNKYIKKKDVFVYKNKKNLGFTKSINFGLKRSNNNVIILNSDTLVSGNWIDRIYSHYLKDNTISTITPFSNNATICNYPDLNGFEKIPHNEKLFLIDDAFKKVNLGKNIEIPTGVGFCMFISRESINKVGLFDENLFPRGYGEENDFCLRAHKNGYKNILACDTFIYHEGNVSFKDSANLLKRHGEKVINSHYPNYSSLVQRFISSDLQKNFIIAASIERIRGCKRKKIIHFTHSLGGGTDKYIQNVLNQSDAFIIIFSIRPNAEIQIKCDYDTYRLDFVIPTNNFDELVNFVDSFNVDLIHINHLLNLTFDLQKLIDILQIPFIFTLHDYFSICPRIFLVNTENNYCKEEGISSCQQCLSQSPMVTDADITLWRQKNKWLFTKSLYVICPSIDAYKRIIKYHPNAIYKIVEHEKLIIKEKDIRKKSLAVWDNQILNIAILGTLVNHKGLKTLILLLDYVLKHNMNINFIIFGDCHADLTKYKTIIHETGPYESDDDLNGNIKKYNPKVVLFLSEAPETFSFTLTQAIINNLFIIAPKIGAFEDRLKDYKNKLIFNNSNKIANIVDHIQSLKNIFFYHHEVKIKESKSFYNLEYLKIDKSKFNKNKKINILVFINNLDSKPDICSYVRLIEPFSKLNDNEYDVQFTSEISFLEKLNYDFLVFSRIPNISLSKLKEVFTLSKKYNIKIIYDLDDNLLDLPVNHPEYNTYEKQKNKIYFFLFRVDLVWVSTITLKNNIKKINSNISVIPNSFQINSQKLPQNNDDDYPIKLLLMGTTTHSDDLNLIKHTLVDLKKSFKNKIQIDIIGMSNEKIFGCNHIKILPEVANNYLLFRNWFEHNCNYDLGIIPLVNNNFNRCKSSIKIFDYLGSSIIPVVSDLSNIYPELKHNFNSIKVDNSKWYDSLSKLIVNKKLIKKLKDNIKNAKFKNLESINTIRKNSLHSLQSISYKDFNFNNDVINISDLSIDRNFITTSYISGSGIEVGALQNPSIVSESAHVKYVDRFSKPDLYRHYPELKKFNLVDVDIIDNGEELKSFHANSVDFIIANHFIEHCQNPIKTLLNFYRVIKHNGIIFMALPDMRFSFDKNRKKTTLKHVLNDYNDNGESSRYSHFIEWARDVEPFFGRNYSKAEIIKRADALLEEDYSIHFHVWDPKEFYKLLKYSITQHSLSLHIESFFVNHDEMIVILRKAVKN